MAITQERMLALLAAARDLLDAYERGHTLATRVFDLHGRGLITSEDAIRQLRIIHVLDAKPSAIGDTMGTIAKETTHFRHVARRNERRLAKATATTGRAIQPPGIASPVQAMTQEELDRELEELMGPPPATSPQEPNQ